MALLPAATCCCSCPKESRGIHDGDTIRTTVVSNATAEATGVAASCGPLGDLPPGAVLTSKASVVDSNGPPACFGVLSMTAETLSTGTLVAAPSGVTNLELPNGCTGQFDIYFQSSSETSSFLDNAADGGAPNWWLIRRFQPSGAVGLCFPNGAPTLPCIDAFVADNVRE